MLDTQLFHDVFNASPIGIVIEDMQGQPMYANPAFCSFLGFTEEELRDKHCVDFSPPEDAEKDWDLFQQLRAGAIDHYQIEKRYFRRDGSLVWGRLSLSLLDHRSSPLVVAMVEDITTKKTAEEALRVSEERFRLAQQQQIALLQTREELLKTFVRNVPADVAMLDREMRYLAVSEQACSNYGIDSSQALGRSFVEVLPIVPQHWQKLFGRALAGEILRADADRWDRPDGTVWMSWEIRPWLTPEGNIGGVLIFAVNITARKQMEEALSATSRKLIEAQEEERKRIARELHDDISQRLALLSLEMDRLQINPSDAPSRLQELQALLIEIGDDVQALSHKLHSSKIEYLGLVGGIKSWCREFSEQYKIEIDFDNNLFTAPPVEVGLCLFRVLQEALNNALKHSGTTRIEVRLTELSGEVHLAVRDSGCGFNVEGAKHGKGLGLASMEERVRLVHGSLEIDSNHLGGTTVRVHVPLSSPSVHKVAG